MNHHEKIRERGAAVIVRGRRILLMRRDKNGEVYYVFPGGGIEAWESAEDATIREIKEEFEIDITIDRLLFALKNEGWGGREPQNVHYFLVRSFVGTPSIGGEEAASMNAKNRYLPVWIDIDALESLDALYPRAAAQRISAFLREVLVEDLRNITRN